MKKFAKFSSLFPRSPKLHFKMLSVQPCGTLITVCLAEAHIHSPRLLQNDN